MTSTPEMLLTNQVWPVMLTPMHSDRTIDWDGVDRITDWYIDAGITGLFTNSRSSEVEFLSAEERVQLAERVVKRANGRAAVVATGTFGAPAADEIETIKQISDVGADAVVILTNHLGNQAASEAAWSGKLETIVEGTGDIKLGFYECPTPWKRVVPAPVFEWAAHTGRFVFHKDLSFDPGDMAAKIAAARGTDLRIYNGEITSTYQSIIAGAHGHSGYASSLNPHLMVWLCANAHRDDEQVRTVQRLMSVFERMIGLGYPSSAKQLLAATGQLDITPYSRMPGANPLGAHDFDSLTDMVALIESLDLKLN
ncbi:dihydrodipicolinate synthase family protein [Pseudonocardia nematodicida]|uniref:Dihydrodipicolinate synthase family protein n=1 Tax=Pseudonocardia nematodicida TaxID=1206997 RepID=A0ABV1KHZ6_9PSEU